MGARAEFVEMVEKRFGYFPRLFCWRGRRFEVVRVERVWCEARQWPRLAQSRRYAILTCEGSFVLEHDPRRNIWVARQAPAGALPAPTRPARRIRGEGYGNRLVVVR